MKYLSDVKTILVQSAALVICIAGTGTVHAQPLHEQDNPPQRPQARDEVYGNKESLSGQTEALKKKQPSQGSGVDQDTRWTNPSPGVYRPNRGAGHNQSRGGPVRSNQDRPSTRPNQGLGADRSSKPKDRKNQGWGSANLNQGLGTDSDARSIDRSNRSSGLDRSGKSISRSNTGGTAGSNQGMGIDRAGKMSGSGHHGGGH